MKLYYSPGACSFASHIVLHELALAHETEKVNLRLKKTASGADFTAITAKGYVPALELDSGEVLTEGTAILQYLAEIDPAKRLSPPLGSMARYRLLEWLGYINSEIHKSYSPLFNPTATEEMKAQARAVLARRYAYADQQLEGNPYLLGDAFSVADAYLYTTLTWAGRVGVDLGEFANLTAYQARLAARPSVLAAAAAEFPAK